MAGARSPLLSADGEDLPVSRVSVDVTLVGLLARTTTVLTFRNDHDRALEGELVFPLPDGATVSGYALDIEGQMVEGVVVEERAARVAFETETRKRVDPGLVEWVRGNSFRTRVWPIPPRGTRTVRVSYVGDLLTQGGRALYSLPLRYEQKVDELSVRIEVVSAAAAPEIRSAGLPGLRFSKGEARYVAETHLSGAHLDEDLVVAVPGATAPRAAVEAGDDGGLYFVADDFPPEVPASRENPLRRVGVLWDASLSRAKADLARERGLLARWSAARGDVDIDLVVFRNVPEKARRIGVRNGDTRALLAALEEIAYDGGTSLEALPLSAPVDCFFLFSDGLATLGAPLPPRARAPVFALGSSARADHGALRRIAEASGGAYLSLARLPDEEALRRMGTVPFALLSVDAAPGSIGDVLPAGARPVSGRMTVAGRLLSPQAQVTLRYGRGRDVLASRTFILRRSEATRTGLVPRFWAQQKAADLALDPGQRPALLALGRRFGLVTPATSLLVLETLEQHLAHGIAPARSRPDMRAQYFQLAAQRKRELAEEKEEKLERVAAMWRDYVAWWETDFRLPPPTPRPRKEREPRAGFRDEPAPRPVAPCRGVGGEIHGTATDAQGAVLPGLRVSATHHATRQTVYVETDQNGGFRLCGLSPGLYTFKGEMTGFRTFQPSPFRVSTSRPVSLRVVMELGALTETIQVTIAEADATGTAATITVAEWDPDTPYLAALEEAPAGHAYEAYLRQREEFGGSPAFFLDCADFFLRSGAADLGLRVLTSLLDLKLDEPRLLRVVAHRLQQAGEHDLAVALFEKVAELRPEEPHSARDLALALVARADRHRAAPPFDRRRLAADYRRALDLFDDVVRGQWDSRFDGIEVVALAEANRVLAILQRERLPGRDRVALDPRFRRTLDVDLRIVVGWDTDMTDMDLWVTEPAGEKCSYQNKRTRIGGRLSRDLTGGYGPEEYTVRRADPGAYRIETDFYGSRASSLLGPTTLQATIFTNYARPSEKRETVIVRLHEDDNDKVAVGVARFSRPQAGAREPRGRGDRSSGTLLGK